MKAVDETAISKFGIPSLQLMERAGEGVAEVVLEYVHSHSLSFEKSSCIIFCGKGNNGGDGFVAARSLIKENIPVLCVLLEDESLLRGDAKINYLKLCSAAYTSASQKNKTKNILTIVSFAQFIKQKKKADIIIDAMFGTSFHGKLQGKYLRAAEWMNKQKAFIVAVDIPSGVHGDTGTVFGKAVKANATVTFSNPKLGFYFDRSREYTGEIIIKKIGIPQKAIRRHSSNIFLTEEDDVRRSLPERPINSHKHSVGRIFILAGSKGLTGAALLSSLSAMRSGAGSVILGIPDSQYSVVAKRTLEVMPFALPSTKEGTISEKAMSAIQQKIDWADVVLLGPGLSQQKETQQIIRKIVVDCKKPMVIDADGLNALAGFTELLLKRKSKHLILTPHLGEFRRLFSLSKKESNDEIHKMERAKYFAKKFRVTIILKGAPTFTYTTDGKIFVNSTGNPGMSTAGTGDVLSGIIASLLAQGSKAELAARNGVYIHGKAGDKAENEMGMHGMLAGDIIQNIPAVLKFLTTGK